MYENSNLLALQFGGSLVPRPFIGWNGLGTRLLGWPNETVTLLPVCSLWERRVGELSLPPSSGEEAELSSEWDSPERGKGKGEKYI